MTWVMCTDPEKPVMTNNSDFIQYSRDSDGAASET